MCVKNGARIFHRVERACVCSWRLQSGNTKRYGEKARGYGLRSEMKRE
jgi:hypothetical protein